MDVISPLAKVRGHGSAKGGAKHWWAQRVTAIALVPLGLWFVTSLVQLMRSDYASMVVWFSSPLVALLMSGFVVAMFYHAYLGIQVVLEDYVHKKSTLITLMILLKFGAFLTIAGSLLAIAKLHLGAGQGII